jgi:hypothetical protein
MIPQANFVDHKLTREIIENYSGILFSRREFDGAQGPSEDFLAIGEEITRCWKELVICGRI